MTLQSGDKIPSFKGLTAEGPISSADLKGTDIILYFYPKDDTPGCTIEACDFRDKMPDFKKIKVKVYGVSKDGVNSHARFAKKYTLPFTLIADEDGSICEAFGTWVEKSMYGKKYMGIERATFLIGKDGKIRHVWRNVKAKGHVEEILEHLKNQ